MCQRLRNMRTLGFLREEIFYLRILTVCTVLSTSLLILSQVKSTSEENISGKKENLEIVLKLGEQGELQVRATGKSTMEVVLNSLKTLSYMGENLLVEK